MTRLDPTSIAQELIRRPSVTPLDEGALSVLIGYLKDLGFDCEDLAFGGDKNPAVRNLYAKFTNGEGPNFCFAGHTDVVPAGDQDNWDVDAFGGAIDDGKLWGRGAADMKGAIAAFIAAAADAIKTDQVKGSLSLLITGDEEGEAIHGTRELLEWIDAKGEKIDHCLVGEPTNPAEMGEMIKVGRRGSINCWLTVDGLQGHVAYPQRANNPIPALLRKLLMLSETPLDDGFARFQPSSLQVTDIHIGNPAHNVIPGKAMARFNIRFNPNWTGESIQAWLREQLDALNTELKATYTLDCIVSGEAFLTTDDTYLALLQGAVEKITGRQPDLSTTGGTSDARFIKNYAPVAEFGLVGATMHKTNEHVHVSDIETLKSVYHEMICRYFDTYGADT